MKTIPIIIPQKNDEKPITLSLPKLTKVDKLAKALIGSGIGLFLAGVVSSMLFEDDENPQKQEKEVNQENQDQQNQEDVL